VELSGDALVADLERRFVTADDTVPIGDERFTILRPRNADDLISEADFVKDDRLPYWADVWPSSLVLAARLRGEPGAGRTLLELGCGVGVVATAATLAGYEATVTDYYEDAIRFARANVWRHTGRDIPGRHVDWRELPRDLGVFDRVVASDVLYERTYADLVARAIVATLARGGVAYVADPGRLAAPAFVEAALSLGLHVDDGATYPYEMGPVKQTIRVYALKKR
jgi:predicted nicotinamide N-methyase